MNDSVELNTFTDQGNEVQRCARINPELNRMYDNDNVSKSNKGDGVGAGSPGRGQS